MVWWPGTQMNGADASALRVGICCLLFSSYLGCKARCHTLTELVRWKMSWCVKSAEVKSPSELSQRQPARKAIIGNSNKQDRWLRCLTPTCSLWLVLHFYVHELFLQYQTHTDNTVIFCLGVLMHGCRTSPIVNDINHLRTIRQLMMSFCTITVGPTLLTFFSNFANGNCAFPHQSYRAYRCWQLPRSLIKGGTPGQGVTARRRMTAALMKE